MLTSQTKRFSSNLIRVSQMFFDVFWLENSILTHIQTKSEETCGDSLAKVRAQPKELRIPTAMGI